MMSNASFDNIEVNHGTSFYAIFCTMHTFSDG